MTGNGHFCKIVYNKTGNLKKCADQIKREADV